MIEEKYSRLLYLSRRYQIEKKDLENRKRASYLPTLSWYISMSRYVEEGLSAEETQAQMLAVLSELIVDQRKERRLKELLKELRPIAPKVIDGIKSTLNKSITTN